MNLKEHLYQKDFYGWCLDQAQSMKNRDFENLDWANLIEEIEAVGGWHRQKLTSSMCIIFMHLLKWIYQPEKRSKSWKNSIERERDYSAFLKEENPSLKSSEADCIKSAYRLARREAARETGLSAKDFPEEMPFSAEEALREGWFPE